MKQILCSNWLPKWARRPWIACSDPAQEKNCLEWTYMLGMKSQKVAEDSQNKEDILVSFVSQLKVLISINKLKSTWSVLCLQQSPPLPPTQPSCTCKGIQLELLKMSWINITFKLKTPMLWAHKTNLNQTFW